MMFVPDNFIIGTTVVGVLLVAIAVGLTITSGFYQDYFYFALGTKLIGLAGIVLTVCGFAMSITFCVPEGDRK